jgi:dTDP-4-amino-4,6-dideoxygalactose transaminase
MTSSYRYLAPAGSPLATIDLLRWCGSAFASESAVEVLKHTIRERFGVRHVSLTSTGRAGMTLLLRAMRRLAGPSRTEVVVPSYTCYSVAASAVKAGLRPRVVDISTTTLDYDRAALEQTDFSRVIAIVATNLYGLPNDMPALTTLGRRHGVFVVDDAAQAMGAMLNKKWCGTLGDAGLFSFDKGKNVSAIDGGVLVSNSDELSAALEQEMAEIEAPTLAQSAAHVAKALVYFAMLRPWLYGIPARIPQLGLGKTVYTTDYPVGRADDILMALASTMLRRLDEFTETRRANAAALLESLRGLDIFPFHPLEDSAPAYLRLPILMPGGPERNAALEALTAAGIGATGSYPGSLADIAELQDLLADRQPTATNGREVARRIVTLPTHPFVAPEDIRRIGMVLGGLAGSPRPTSH